MSRFKLRTLTDKEFQNGITQHIFELFDQPLTLDDFFEFVSLTILTLIYHPISKILTLAIDRCA